MVGHIERQSTDLKRHPGPVTKLLRYPRHFLLLACFSVLVGLMSRLHPTGDLSTSFALYGALHALALILALRGNTAIWSKGLFIAFSAALCVLTYRIGAAARELFGAVPTNVAFYSLLGLCSIIGAASYAILIRLSGLCVLTMAQIAAIGAGCMCAAFASLLTATHFHGLGAWWFAVLWWFTFSGGLWHFDRPPRPGTEVGLQNQNASQP